MPESKFIVGLPGKTSLSYAFTTSIIGIVLGLIMLFYPGGTMALMKVGFTFFQIILSFFILYYSLSEAINGFKNKKTWAGVAYLVVGLLAILLVWVLDVNIIYYVIAIFLFIMGISEIIASFSMTFGRFFLFLLGVIDILIAVFIVKNPVLLALLIAWYVLFWGISRGLLVLEIRQATQ